ncbi:MAG: ABC transporter permease [Nitriliruptor sp.]|uniref:ABC transporter permease n=1 Tax=Nitriliruptor sp. TaxID=2448056 RepID=UPI00349FD56B
MTASMLPDARDPSLDATARPEHPELWWALRDTWTVTKRNLRHFLRQPRLLVFSTVQPVMFVVLFAYVFGGVATTALPEGLSYIDFLVPGIFVQSAAFRTTQTAVGLAEDLERGVIDRFRSLPMARVAVLAGRTGADLARNVAVLLLMIAVGYAIGFRFSEGPLAALGAIAVVALFGFALSWVFVLVALHAPGAETAQSAGFVTIFPLVFASSVFVPIETMPTWLQAFAARSPVTAAADAARGLSVGGPVAEPLALVLVWCIGMMLVTVPLSSRRYQRMT